MATLDLPDEATDTRSPMPRGGYRLSGIFAEPDGLPGVGLGRRAVAKILDLVLLNALELLILFMAVVPLMVVAATRGLAAERFLPSLPGATGFGVGIASTVAYFAAFEWLWGTTPGKRLMGLVVVAEDLAPCSLAAALRRNALLVLEMMACGVPAFLAVRSSPRAQRHGDRWAGTIVPRRRDVPAFRPRPLGFLLGSFAAIGAVVAMMTPITLACLVAAFKLPAAQASPLVPTAGDGLAKAPETERAQLYSQGLGAYGRREYPAAIDLWGRLVAAEPTHDEAWNALGLAYMESGRWAEAVAAQRRQLEVTPGHRHAWGNLAWALQHQGSHEEAIAAYRRQIDTVPRDEWAHKRLGLLLEQRRQWQGAKRALRQASAINVGDLSVEVALGRVCLRLGEVADGLGAFERARKIDGSFNLLSELAQYLADEGVALDRATAWAAQATSEAAAQSLTLRIETVRLPDTQRSWGLSWAWYARGLCAFRRGDLAQAERYVRAADSVRSSAQITRDLGRIVEKGGRRAEAADLYAEALAIGHDDEARSRLAQAGLSDVAIPSWVDHARGKRADRRVVRLGTGQLPDGPARVLILLTNGERGAEVRAVRPDPRLDALLARARTATYPAQFPDRTAARIAIWGEIHRNPDTGECVLALMPGVRPPAN